MPSWLAKVAIIIASLTTILLVQSHDPGYSVSLYASTPLVIWVLLGILLCLGLWLTFTTNPVEGLLSVGAWSVLILVIPLARGSYLIGKGDGLTHVGWTRDLLSGQLGSTELLYPVLHHFGATTHIITNIPLNRSLLLLVVVFTVLFGVSTVIATRQISRGLPSVDNRLAVTLSGLSAVLLLPINHVGSYLMPHPTTQAVLLYPLVIFVLFRHQESSDRRWSVLLLALLTLLLFVHPMHGLIMTAILAVALLCLSSASWVTKKTAETRLLVPGSVVGLATLAWAFEHKVFRISLVGYLVQFLMMDFGGSRLSSTSVSLGDIGGSSLDLFLRLLSVSAVFVVLTLMVTWWLIKQVWRGAQNKTTLTSFSVLIALGPVVVGTIVLVFVRGNTVPFRLIAMLMVFGTIFGTIGLARLGGRLGPEKRQVRAALGVFFAVTLVLSAAVYYPSPFIYKGSGEISTAGVQSYATLGEYRAGNQPVRSIRTAPERYFQAAYGVSGAQQRGLLYQGRVNGQRRVPDHFANRRLRTQYAEDYYLFFHVRDRRLETGLYQGFRYSRGDFRYVETEPGVVKYYDSGWVTGYKIDATNSSN